METHRTGCDTPKHILLLYLNKNELNSALCGRNLAHSQLWIKTMVVLNILTGYDKSILKILVMK